MLLSETWLKQKHTNFNFKGYKLVRKDRENKRAGGVGILISEYLDFQEIQFGNIPFNKLDFCALKLIKSDIKIICVYKAPKVNMSSIEWQNIFTQVDSKNTIICGDFNGHHVGWGSQRNDAEGVKLHDVIEDFNMIVLNDGRPTKMTRPLEDPSAIDLSVVSHNLVRKAVWDVLPELLGSDHFVIKIELDVPVIKKNKIPYLKWKESTADWERFRDSLDARLGFSEDITSYSSLITDITTTANDYIETTKPKVIKHRQPIWWDEECSSMFKKRRNALIAYKRLSNMDNYLAYKVIEAQAKRLFKIKSRTTWRSFLNKINKNTPLSDIWRFIKSMKDNSHLTSNSNKLSEQIIEQLMDILAPPSMMEEIHVQTGNTEKCVNFERPFDLVELAKIIPTSSKCTAPGMDRITYNILNNMSDYAKRYMLNVINKCWKNGEYSDQMKEIVVCLILKVGHDPLLPSSYRPISLMPCVTKIYEKMVKSRLEFLCESHNVFPDRQFGFRRNQGTLDAISHVVTDAQCSLTQNKYLMCIFVDLKGAYDAMNLGLLAQSLYEVGLSENVSRNIVSLYQNRKIYIRDDSNQLHGPRFTSLGIPQGSILSPILFNIYTRHLHDLFENPIKCVQYADDICLYVTRNTYEDCLRDFRHILYVLKMWVDEEDSTLTKINLQLCFSPDIGLPLLSSYQIGPTN